MQIHSVMIHFIFKIRVNFNSGKYQGPCPSFLTRLFYIYLKRKRLCNTNQSFITVFALIGIMVAFNKQDIFVYVGLCQIKRKREYIFFLFHSFRSSTIKMYQKETREERQSLDCVNSAEIEIDDLINSNLSTDEGEMA